MYSIMTIDICRIDESINADGPVNCWHSMAKQIFLWKYFHIEISNTHTYTTPYFYSSIVVHKCRLVPSLELRIFAVLSVIKIVRKWRLPRYWEYELYTHHHRIGYRMWQFTSYKMRSLQYTIDLETKVREDFNGEGPC